MTTRPQTDRRSKTKYMAREAGVLLATVSRAFGQPHLVMPSLPE